MDMIRSGFIKKKYLGYKLRKIGKAVAYSKGVDVGEVSEKMNELINKVEERLKNDGVDDNAVLYVEAVFDIVDNEFVLGDVKVHIYSEVKSFSL